MRQVFVFFAALLNHFDAGVEQKGAEEIQYPFKAADEDGTDENHEGAQDDGAEHAVEQDAVLVLRRHFEVAEDHEEDEEIVYRQRFFQNVAGEVFHNFGFRQFVAVGLIMGDFPVEPAGEGAGDGDPHYCPGQSFFAADFVGATFFQRQHVDGDHGEDGGGEYAVKQG